ncbi:MAG: chitobiase/beta-hexosaminidase C-terminal domain-containing protein [Lachnospiraceae bacterium]|nr:chitobiase/beta-hexosaminidase C-terminal domain-containing protein [Lachnospiraceae bacterium]
MCNKRRIALCLCILLAISAIMPKEFTTKEAMAVVKSEVNDMEYTDRQGLEEIQCISLGEMEDSEMFEPEASGESDSSTMYYSRNKKSAIYNSADWDIYATNYYYNQLSEEEKVIYDKFDAMCLAYLEGTESIKGQMVDGEMFYPTKAIDTGIALETEIGTATQRAAIKERNANKLDAAIEVAEVFFFSNPQYYFLQPQFANGTKSNRITICLGTYGTLANGTVRKGATQNVKNFMEQWTNEVSKGTTIVEKEKIAHDLIIKGIVYEENEYDQSVYSVVNSGESVCAGYAKMFQLLMNAQGIDAIEITSEGHAWNAIRLFGTWYLVDCTWDDTDLASMPVVYNFFNVNGDQIDDQDGNSGAHIPEDVWQGLLPDFTRTSRNPDARLAQTEPGEVVANTAKLSTPTMQIKDNKNGTNTVTITSDNANARIFYTTDGKNPSVAQSRSKIYKEALVLSDASQMKAVAVLDDYLDSEIADGNIPAPSPTPTPTPTPTVKPTSNPTVTPTKIPISITGGKISTIKARTYNGKAQTPSIVLTVNQKVLKNGTDYKVQYANNKSVGYATVTAIGIGSYTGTLKTTFKVNPKKVQSVKAKRIKKGTFTLKWKRMTGITGYEVVYATNKKFKNAKKKTVSSYKKTSISITYSKAKKKTCYFKVRAYKKVKNKKLYGKYSKVVKK